MDALVELFSTKGRANRLWYFFHVVLDDLVVATMLILTVLIALVGGTVLHPVVAVLFALPALGIMLGGMWAAFAITVKRFHDMDQPWWYSLFLLIPLVNLYFICVLLFKRGTIGPNQFGPDPLAAAALSSGEPRYPGE